MRLFSPQCKDKDRRRRKLFAIWSINKNANSGKLFLSCDNVGDVTAAPEDGEMDGPARNRKPESFICKARCSDSQRNIFCSVSAAFCREDVVCWTVLVEEARNRVMFCQSVQDELLIKMAP